MKQNVNIVTLKSKKDSQNSETFFKVKLQALALSNSQFY